MTDATSQRRSMWRRARRLGCAAFVGLALVLFVLVSVGVSQNRRRPNLGREAPNRVELAVEDSLWRQYSHSASRYHQHITTDEPWASYNRKFVHDDGSEGVYDWAGELVLSPENRGTYNFYGGLGHKVFDIVLGYWFTGTGPEDTTTFRNRLPEPLGQIMRRYRRGGAASIAADPTVGPER